MKAVFIVCLCVFTCALIYLGYILYVYINQKMIEENVGNLFDEAKQIEEISVPAPDAPDDTDIPDNDEPPEPEESEWEKERRLLLEAEARGRLIYADILEINEDFLGMIEIPGLIERQPYVMSSDNNEYLSRDFNGNRSITGTVFLSMFNDRLMMDNNSAIFGHYTETGGMFAKLLSYKHAATFASSPVVILDGLIGESTWIIFAAFVVEPESWWMLPYNDESDYAVHLDELRARSLFNTDVDVTPNDRIITLAVCDYTYEDMRFVVHARKLRSGEKAPESVLAETNPDRKDFTVPHLNSISDVDMTGAAFTTSVSGSRFFYYVPRAGNIERFVGNSRDVQGPFPALTYAGISPESYISAIIVRADDSDEITRNVYLAVQDAGGVPGISLFSAGMTTSTFRHDGLLTPEGVDARYPVIQKTGNSLWLLYSVPGENDSSKIYKMNIFDKDPEHLHTTAGVSDACPLGVYTTEGQEYVVWYDPGSGSINGVYTGTDNVTNLHSTYARARVMLYGEPSGTSVKFAVERAGTIGFDTINLGITPDSIVTGSGSAANTNGSGTPDILNGSEEGEAENNE